MKECFTNLLKATMMKQVIDYVTNAFCLKLLVVLNCNRFTPPTAYIPPEPPSTAGSFSFFSTQYVYRVGWFLMRNTVVTLSSFCRRKRKFGRKSEESAE